MEAAQAPTAEGGERWPGISHVFLTHLLTGDPAAPNEQPKWFSIDDCYCSLFGFGITLIASKHK